VAQVEDDQSREEALCWSLGVDGTFGWHMELPSAESLRCPVEDWVARQRGVWPSQQAAISALLLHGASHSIGASHRSAHQPTSWSPRTFHQVYPSASTGPSSTSSCVPSPKLVTMS
jgi:hypothetical protein